MDKYNNIYITMSSRPFHLKKILGDNHIISYNQSNYGMNGIMFGQLGSIIFGGDQGYGGDHDRPPPNGPNGLVVFPRQATYISKDPDHSLLTCFHDP